MSSMIIRITVIATVLASCIIRPQFVTAAEPTAQVNRALAQMHAWVGAGENGRKWRTYLRSAELETQLEKGQPDADVVAKILARYQSGAGGLDQQSFVKVREALNTWLDELQLPAKDQLPELLLQAKGDYDPVTADKVAEAKRQLAQAARRLETYLNTGGKNGEAWKDYLQWSALESELAADTEPDFQKLGELYRLYTSDHEGLELPVFADTADSLRRYFDLAVMAANPKAEELYQQEIENLADSVKAYAEESTEEENWNIAQRLGWLQGTGQVPDLIRGVRKYYSSPNLFAQMSGKLVAAGIEDKVERNEPVSDYILGTSIHGQGRTTGELKVELAPSQNKAVLDLLLYGTTATDTVGYNGPVSIYADGITKFAARKRVVLDPDGFRGLSAACNARTSSDVNGIGGGMIARRVASRKVSQSTSTAERIASRHAEERVCERLDQEAAEMLSKANKQYQEDFRAPLVRQRAFPEDLRFSSTKNSIHVTAVQADRFQLGAPDDPPQMAGPHDMSVQIHETMPNNLAASLLAGRTVTDEEFREMSKKLNDGKLPEDFSESEDEPPFSITFAQQKPITFWFNDGGFKVTVRGRRFTSGERKLSAQDITAQYNIETRPDGVTLVRQGDLEVAPPGKAGQSRSIGDVSLLAILRRKFGKLFKPEMKFTGMELPGEWKKAGKLHANEVTSRSGWVKIGWDLAGSRQVASGEATAAAK